MINTKTISLFENEHLSGLYSSLQLSQVQDVFQPPNFNATGIFCFYVIRGPKKAGVQKGGVKPKGEIRMRLCFADALSMESWRKAIDAYDVCKFVPKNDNEPDDEDTVDGGSQAAMRNREAQEEDKMKALYEADEKAEEGAAEEKEKQRQQLKEMQAKMDEIKAKMEAQRIQDAKDRHRAIEERKRLMELNKFLRLEEDCLTKKEREKTTFELENSIKRIESSSDEDSMNQISGLGEQLNSESNKERLIKEHARIEQLECEREQQEKLKNLMVQTTIAYEHIMDTGDCYSSDLATSKITTIQKTCLNLFTSTRPANLKGLKDCIEEKNFCNSCCNFVIGEAHETQRFSCKQKCAKAMTGDGPSVIVPVSRRIKDLDTVSLISF